MKLSEAQRYGVPCPICSVGSIYNHKCNNCAQEYLEVIYLGDNAFQTLYVDNAGVERLDVIEVDDEG